MLSFLGFWASLVGLLVSWELVLYSPSYIFYWFALSIASSVFLILSLTKNDSNRKKGLIDYLAFILFCSGAFWWFLWLDLGIIKYLIPLIIWGILVYFAKDSIKIGIISKKEKLAVFFGGTFFWSSISFGLLTVLGWKIWICLVIFIVSFGILSFASVQIFSDQILQKIKAWLLMMLLSVEFFICFAWLPFMEITLAFILMLCIIFIYDLEKYYLDPGLINKKIITRKIMLYFLFLVLALISTPWY